MHTTELTNGILAHHDGGYEGGPVILVIPAEQADLKVDKKGPYVERDTVSVTVPFDALKQLVVNYLRGEAISFYEDAEDDEVLRGLGPWLRGGKADKRDNDPA